MTELELRHPCPVCLGVTQEKLRFELPAAAKATTGRLELVLDHCARCGGVWFGHGEVQQLRRVDANLLWTRIARRTEVHRMQCHHCHAPVLRSASHCPNCRWNLALDCPICARTMNRVEQDGLRLDVCRTCKGVWFDHDELAAIWKLEATALLKRRQDSDPHAVVLLEALTFDPFLTYYGLSAAGHVAGGAIEALAHVPGALANAPGAIAGAAEAAGEVASSVFETIVELIGGLFG
jgi:Zn-finger nucleic acid-binding protein